MQGVLFKYGPRPSHLAFKSGQNKRHVVLVGGLTDGLLFAPYANPLSEALDTAGWSLVQAQLTSSYQGYGTASLDEDAGELLLLLDHLVVHQQGEAAVLMGHSTGCQVSDREWLHQFEELEDLKLNAEQMVRDGNGDQILCRFHICSDQAPMTAWRFLSLYAEGGDDDMFSSDLSDETLKEILSPLGQLPCLIVASGADEAVPKSVDVETQVQRLGAAIGSAAHTVILPNANHACEGHEQDVVSRVVKFIEAISK